MHRRRLTEVNQTVQTLHDGWPPHALVYYQRRQQTLGGRVGLTGTRWLYCVECPQYSIRLEALSYLCASCLLRAFDVA